MKRSRLLPWSCPRCLLETSQPLRLRAYRPFHRNQSTAVASSHSLEDSDHESNTAVTPNRPRLPPSPPVSAAKKSPKLSSLHARLALPSQFPLETLARTLVDASADSTAGFNNRAFSVLGNDLLSFYTSEYLICQYPRLPLAVVFAAMWAYVGSKALATITREWGVELAAAPGCEVDPGLLQFKRRPPELKAKSTEGQLISAHPDDNPEGKKSMNSRAILDDAFGDLRPKVEDLEADMENGVDVEKASATFVQALMGAVYLHGGRSVTKQFYREHFMSRQLNVADLFNFPTANSRRQSAMCQRRLQSPCGSYHQRDWTEESAPCLHCWSLFWQ